MKHRNLNFLLIPFISLPLFISFSCSSSTTPQINCDTKLTNNTIPESTTITLTDNTKNPVGNTIWHYTPGPYNIINLSITLTEDNKLIITTHSGIANDFQIPDIWITNNNINSAKLKLKVAHRHRSGSITPEHIPGGNTPYTLAPNSSDMISFKYKDGDHFNDWKNLNWISDNTGLVTITHNSTQVDRFDFVTSSLPEGTSDVFVKFTSNYTGDWGDLYFAFGGEDYSNYFTLQIHKFNN